MGIIREMPPTAGFRITLKELSSLLNSGASSLTLEDDFIQYLNTPYAKMAPSGTAALYLIAETIKELTPKRTIVIPSYICASVPLAIKRAGFKIEVCDITGRDFNYRLDELEAICAENRDIAAVVAAHIGGIPVDFDSIETIAKQRGIFTIEDCAQSLGAEYKEKKTGTLADFSFFSLARGKGLTIYEGGVVVTKDSAFSSLLDKNIARLLKRSPAFEALRILELIGYSIFYRPGLFWFAYRLPQIFWNALTQRLKAEMENYSPDFPLIEVSRRRLAFGHTIFRRLENEIEDQRKKAIWYMDTLSGLNKAHILKKPGYGMATYPFVTLLFNEPSMKIDFMKMLGNSGLGISELYTLPITCYPYLKSIMPEKSCEGARHIIDRHITLSCNSFLTLKDMEAVCHNLRGYACTTS